MNNTTKLIFKILLAILFGSIIGKILIANNIGLFLLRGFVSASDIISQFLSFFIPIAVLTIVLPGIIELGSKASKMTLIGFFISFASFILMGIVCVFSGYALIPLFLSKSSQATNLGISTQSITGFFPVLIRPFFDIVSAMLIAITFGIAATKVSSENILKLTKEIEKCSYTILNNFLIPLLPFYIFCILAKLSATGDLFLNLGNFAILIGLVFVISNGYTLIIIWLFAKMTKRSFIRVFKAYLPAYLVAFGTRSSVATVPVSLISAEKIEISPEIREFAVPFLAAIHMLGDMAMQVFGAMAIYYIFAGEMLNLNLMLSYVFLLASLLIVVPGTPGGAAVTTKPFLISFLGFTPPLSETFFAIAVTNDSFATGTNIMADCAIMMLLERIYNKLKRNPVNILK